MCLLRLLDQAAHHGLGRCRHLDLTLQDRGRRRHLLLLRDGGSHHPLQMLVQLLLSFLGIVAAAAWQRRWWRGAQVSMWQRRGGSVGAGAGQAGSWCSPKDARATAVQGRAAAQRQPPRAAPGSSRTAAAWPAATRTWPPGRAPAPPPTRRSAARPRRLSQSGSGCCTAPTWAGCGAQGWVAGQLVSAARGGGPSGAAAARGRQRQLRPGGEPGLPCPSPASHPASRAA